MSTWKLFSEKQPKKSGIYLVCTNVFIHEPIEERIERAGWDVSERRWWEVESDDFIGCDRPGVICWTEMPKNPDFKEIIFDDKYYK